MIEIGIDFETRSTTDLKKSGVYRYVEDPNTDVWCMAYAIEDDEPQIWTPPEPFPADIYYQLTRHDAVIRAWNAQFERIIWNVICRKHGFPELPMDRFYCTMVDALAMGLSGALDKAAKALRLPVKKDMAGNRLAKQMSRPRKTKDGSLKWWDVPDKLDQLYDYCIQDVRVERSIKGVTRRISDRERRVYLLDQEINDRGVFLDQTLAKSARQIALEGVKRANALVAQVTNGDVKRITEVGKMQFWLNEQGCDIPNLQKNTLQEYLSHDLPDEIKDVLLARAEGGKTSVSKLDAMFDYVCSDSRMRGLLQFNGAATGRWAGRGVQPQNLVRPTVEDVEYFIPLVMSYSNYETIDLYDNPVAIVSSLLRSMITAGPEHELKSGDFKAIEARIVAWFAGQTDLLDMFAAHDRGEGEEVYVIAADELGTNRHTAKQIILGSGFGMGGDKFYKMGTEQYGIKFDELDVPRGVEIKEEKSVEKEKTVWALYHGEGRWELPSYGKAVSHGFIKLYRARWTKIPHYWYAAQDMVLGAVQNPGSVRELGSVKATFRGNHLWIILPSRRPLCYFNPTVVERETPWGEMRNAVKIWSKDSVTHMWRPQILYGGLIVENIVQATARDVMVHAMLNITEAGYPIVLTVHDEIVAEVPKSYGSLEEFITIMERSPSWADGLPIKVSGWEGKRYRKD